MLIEPTLLHAFMKTCVSAFGRDDSEMGSGSLSSFSSLLPWDEYSLSHLISLLDSGSFRTEWDEASKALLSKALNFYLVVCVPFVLITASSSGLQGKDKKASITSLNEKRVALQHALNDL